MDQGEGWGSAVLARQFWLTWCRVQKCSQARHDRHGMHRPWIGRPHSLPATRLRPNDDLMACLLVATLPVRPLPPSFFHASTAVQRRHGGGGVSVQVRGVFRGAVRGEMGREQQEMTYLTGSSRRNARRTGGDESSREGRCVVYSFYLCVQREGERWESGVVVR